MYFIKEYDLYKGFLHISVYYVYKPFGCKDRRECIHMGITLTNAL